MRNKALSLVLLIGLATAACSSSSQAGSPPSTKLTALAAASLTEVLPKIGSAFTKQHPGVTFSFSFGGTDQLATQIKQGAPADVFAGASLTYGDQLAAASLIEPFRKFCTNQLVLVVPTSNPAGIASLQDLATKPVKLVIGSETVPVGSYTRTVLKNLDTTYGSTYSSSVLGKVVSNEDSVTSIITKVQIGEADAGFVYITDSMAASTRVKVFTLPADAQAVATYPIAVVKGSKRLTAARQFVDYVLSAPAQQLLGQAGFGPPPGS
jgi:molybdate transport system substrate-binding protein